MKKSKEEINLSFQIKEIQLLEVKLNQQSQPFPPQMTFHFNLTLEHRINQENKLMIVTTAIEIVHEDKETRLGALKASCIFEVNNIEDFVVDGQILFTEDAMVPFDSISISTTRGLMFSQFSGTFLHNAILPIVDPKSFIREGIR
jgi:hypothetical protein